MRFPKNSSSNSIKDWAKSFFVAVAFATAIKWFAGEHFMVPTSSMEPCLLPGDHLLVSKLGYGPRIPITPLQIPLSHKTIWGYKAFSDKIKLHYFRLFSIDQVKRGDVVVFNYPAEIEYPLDIREFFVKRCVGLPGDTIKVSDFVVYANDIKENIADDVQIRFYLKTDSIISKKDFNKANIYEYTTFQEGYIVHSSREAIKKLEASDINFSAYYIKEPVIADQNLFCNKDCIFEWNYENFGPVKVPYKSFEIDINRESIALYGFAILHHEDLQNVKIIDHELFINENKVEKYVFKKDYYFMMGDNRCNSKDSRFWGFVPEDHIVGKPLCVVFSRDIESDSKFINLRWNRFFKIIHPHKN